MTNNELRQIKDKFSKADKIYAYMYGAPRRYVVGVGEEPDKIIEIKTDGLEKADDCFRNIWGWPGPDSTIYRFEDFGTTWGFSKADITKTQGGKRMFILRLTDRQTGGRKEYTATTAEEVLDIVRQYKKQDIYIAIDTEEKAGQTVWITGCGDSLEEVVKNICNRLLTDNLTGKAKATMDAIAEKMQKGTEQR